MSEVFKWLLVSDGASREECNFVKTNLHKFLVRVNKNVYKGIPGVFYEVLKSTSSISGVPTKVQFISIVERHADKFIAAMAVKDFATDTKDSDLTRQEFISACESFYDSCTAQDKSGAFEIDMENDVIAYEERLFNKAMEDAYKIFAEGSEDKKTKKLRKGVRDAVENMQGSLSKIVEMREVTNRRVIETLDEASFLQDLDSLDTEDFMSSQVSKTNITEIDEEVSLGKGDVFVIMADLNGGKTRMCVNMAYNSIIAGKNVAYGALEGKLNELKMYFVARHLVSKYDFSILETRDLIKRSFDATYKKVIVTAMNDFYTNPNYGKLTFFTAPVDVEDFESLLEAIWMQNPFDVVTIDHTSLVTSRLKDSKREVLEAFMPKLETAAKYFKGVGFLAICTHQMTDTAVALLKESGKDSSRASSDSRAVMKSASGAITMLIDDDMSARDAAQVFKTKTRLSRKTGKPVDIYANLGWCYYSNAIE